MDLHLSKCDAFSRAFARQNVHFETAIQSLDSLNEQIVELLLSEESAARLSDSQWSRQCDLQMVLMQRLLADTRCKFRKMMADNQALASRIDLDIQSAHVQVSALRAELADTNQRIQDITMAGNVITTCMPPTNTTTTVSGAGDSGLVDHGKSSKKDDQLALSQPQPRCTGTGGGGGGGGQQPKADPLSKTGREKSSCPAPPPDHHHQQQQLAKCDNSTTGRDSGKGSSSEMAPHSTNEVQSSDAKSKCDQQRTRKLGESRETSAGSSRISTIRVTGPKNEPSGNVEKVGSRVTDEKKTVMPKPSDSPKRDQKGTSKDLGGVPQIEKGFADEDSGTFVTKPAEVPTEVKGAPEEACSQEAKDCSLRIKYSALERDLEAVHSTKSSLEKENSNLAERVELLEKELRLAKEALSALKQDRKRLKAEKFDLLTQMKQLYSTLEDKEDELREFIRNYEQKMKESEENLKKITRDREDNEKEKWSLLKRARDEAERSVLLCTQIGLKDAQIKDLQEQINALRDKSLSSDTDSRMRTNGYGSPASMSYRTINGMDPSDAPTPTPGSDPATSSSYAGTPTITVEFPESTLHKDRRMLSSDEHRPSLLSRSAEDIFNSAGVIDDSGKKMSKCKEKKGTWGSISRVFSRSRQRRKPLDPGLFEDQRGSWSPKGSVTSSPLSEECYVQKLRLLEETHGTPMQHWRAAAVLAWLEITMDMPQYGPLCAENIKSGKVLLELSESELEEGLGISNVMHRRKLRLAIDEHREPSLCPYPKICLMTHSWVIEEWLPGISLTTYLSSFSEHLVDGRVLNTLSKKDLEKHFGITRKFHQVGIMHAIHLLRMMHFDRQILNQRRLNCENMDVDPLVWTNQRFIKWAKSIDLTEYAENLMHSGVHGALVVLEPSFTADTMASALGIPASKNIIRRHLTTEFQNLVQPARLSMESEMLVARKTEKRLGSASSSSTLGSQGKINSLVSSYARRTLDRNDKRRSSWRFSTWKSSQESLKSTASTSRKSCMVDRPCVLPLSPQMTTATSRHRRTLSSHSDVETLTVTPV